ncbi:hypothetical protein BC941DRAFT_432322 [Chlamydoabsidia padenii]|nr:hypothetical protein BC941DRAFT_432322 [Chlamydoabsidia padenii]
MNATGSWKMELIHLYYILDSHSSYSFVTDIVPSSHLRQKCERKLAHLDRDMKVLDEASFSQVSTSSTEMSTPSSQMSFSSMGMSSLKVTNEEFLLPYEDFDACFLNDLPDGYYPLILPQFTIMATNIMNMYADNRVNYVMKKAITVQLRINLCPEREKSYYDRINGVTVPTTIYYGDAGRVLVQESMGKKEEVRTGYKWHCIRN